MCGSLWDCLQKWGLSCCEGNIRYLPSLCAFGMCVFLLGLSLEGHCSTQALSDSQACLQKLCSKGSKNITCRTVGTSDRSIARADQVAFDFIQSSLGKKNLRMRVHSQLLWLGCLHMEKLFCNIHSEPLLFQIMCVVCHSSARPHCREPGSVFSVTSLQGLRTAGWKAISSPG